MYLIKIVIIKINWSATMRLNYDIIIEQHTVQKARKFNFPLQKTFCTYMSVYIEFFIFCTLFDRKRNIIHLVLFQNYALFTQDKLFNVDASDLKTKYESYFPFSFWHEEYASVCPPYNWHNLTGIFVWLSWCDVEKKWWQRGDFLMIFMVRIFIFISSGSDIFYNR